MAVSIGNGTIRSLAVDSIAPPNARNINTRYTTQLDAVAFEVTNATNFCKKIASRLAEIAKMINEFASRHLSKKESTVFWSQQNMELCSLLHDIVTLKTFALRANEECIQMVVKAATRENEWGFITYLKDRNIL